MAKYIRTLSQLPEISAAHLASNAYFQVSNPVSVDVDLSRNEFTYVYASKKIKKEEVSKDIINDVREDLKSNGISTQNFGWLYDEFGKLTKEAYVLSGKKSFTKNPSHKNEITDFQASTTANSDLAVNLEALRKYSNLNTTPTLNPTFGFVTHLSSTNNTSANYNLFRIDGSGRNITVVSKPSFVFSPSSAKSLAQNEFLFRIRPGEKESDPWTAPASGIFTCYGWLDEIHNEKVSNENRWVALMAFQSQLKTWTTLQVQPFIKNNYLSYVGFTFPVHKGTLLKVVTGFAVGSNSDKYFKNGNSLANNVANAFLGGIYTGLSVDNGSGSNVSYKNVDPETFDPSELCNMITAQIEHEISCDKIVNSQLSTLSTGVSRLGEETEKRTRYINAASLSGDNPIDYSAIVFGNGNKYGATDLKNGIQQMSYIDGQLHKYTCGEIDFNNNGDGLFSVKDYYAPPTFTETRENKIGYVERAFYSKGVWKYPIASDGMYFYYRVMKDSTVLIKFSHDTISINNTNKCWLLCDTEREYSNVKAIPILEKVEVNPFNGYPPESISLPLSAGSILMFGVYVREKIDVPWYEDILQPPVLTTGNNIVPTSLSQLKDNPNMREYTYSGYHGPNNTTVSRKSYLLNANGSTVQNVASDNPTEKQYKLSQMTFGNVCYIYELR